MLCILFWTFVHWIAHWAHTLNPQVIGDPLNRGTAHGPQNHKAHLDKLLEYVEIGVKEGATLAYSGKRVDRPGYFLHPTVFTNVEDHMFIAKEESFGPIMVISKFANGWVEFWDMTLLPHHNHHCHQQFVAIYQAHMG